MIMDRFLVKFITISYSQFAIPSGTFSLFWSKIFDKKRQDLQRFEREVFVVNEISLKYNTRVIAERMYLVDALGGFRSILVSNLKIRRRMMEIKTRRSMISRLTSRPRDFPSKTSDES